MPRGKLPFNCVDPMGVDPFDSSFSDNPNLYSSVQARWAHCEWQDRRFRGLGSPSVRSTTATPPQPQPRGSHSISWSRLYMDHPKEESRHRRYVQSLGINEDEVNSYPDPQARRRRRQQSVVDQYTVAPTMTSQGGQSRKSNQPRSKAHSQGGRSKHSSRRSQGGKSGAPHSERSGQSGYYSQRSKQPGSQRSAQQQPRVPLQRIPEEEVAQLNERDRAAYVFREGQERHYEKQDQKAQDAALEGTLARLRGEGSAHGSKHSQRSTDSTEDFLTKYHARMSTAPGGPLREDISESGPAPNFGIRPDRPTRSTKCRNYYLPAGVEIPPGAHRSG